MSRSLRAWALFPALALLPFSALITFQEPGSDTSEGGTPTERVRYVEVPGEKAFTGRMIARPVQIDVWLQRGLSITEAEERRAAARNLIVENSEYKYVPQTDEYVFEIPEDTTENKVANRLLRTGNFQYAEPDWLLSPIGCPNDTFFGSQWHHEANRMDSCDAWDLHTGNPTVTVGICDTGILTTHEDLQLHRLEGYNAVDEVWENSGGDISNIHWHGTAVTGSAAANGDNNLGVAGVGWNLSHRMMRVSNLTSGNAALSVLQHAARTSVEAGDRVANVSYSGCDTNSNLTTATYIKSIGGLLVWSAGNDERNLTFGNRDADDLIVVGATNPSDDLAWFSAYGQFVDVTAPGEDIATTGDTDNSTYWFVGGTSFAAPVTAGVIAMIWSVSPSLTPDQVESILKGTCDDLGAGGIDDTFAHGRVNLYEAVLSAGAAVPPTADFVGSPTAGIDPLSVNFTNLVTGTPTTWLWDFGDGNTSSAQDPSHAYGAPGQYTVSLSVSNAFGSDTETKVNYIDVQPAPNPPVASFTAAPTSGLAPLSVDFTDTSTNTPTSWSWNFGDGNSSTAQNPSHSYTVAGNYTVSLTATNADGSDTDTQVGVITVLQPPVASFTATPTSGDVPLNVSFTDTSTGGTPTSWSWTFGDGNGSSAQNPSHTYTAPGVYTVSMTATNADGSDTDTQVGLITVLEPPVASFTATPTSGDVPLDVDFTDTSTGGTPTSWSWTFGDGNSSNAQNPSHTYTAPGVYTVSMTATNADGSDTDTQVNLITVLNPPVASFSATPTSGSVPLDVNFTDTSTGGAGTSWAWTFGDGNGSSAQNPSHTYTTPGTYTVSLTVTNADGNDTAVQSNLITVLDPPVASFTASPTAGDAPLLVSFTDTSTGGAGTSWSWTFGDGNGSSAQNPSHTYTAPGNYTVSMTVTNADGSDTSTQVNLISVSLPPNPPIASFTASPTAGIAPLLVGFTDTSTGGAASSWSWDFGDGNGSTTQNPSHTYTTPGVYTVSLTATNVDGSDTDTQVNLITVSAAPNPPVASFTASPTAGDAPLLVGFTDTSTGGAATSWSWDFGDGNGSTAQNPNHTYTAAGTYTVSMTATNADGSDTDTQTNLITVNDPSNPPVASFSATPTSGAMPLLVAFSDTSTGGAGTSWLWDFGDGSTSTAQNPNHTYYLPGTYTVSLTVTNADGSDTDTQVNLINVGPPASQGYILSRNPDFSTDDRNFTTSETMYVLFWSDQVDPNDIRIAKYRLKDPAGPKVTLDLTNHGDGHYTAAFDLSTLPSNATLWKFKGGMLDFGGTLFKRKADLVVIP